MADSERGEIHDHRSGRRVADCAVRVLGEAKRDAEVKVVKGAWKGSSVKRDCDAAVVRRLGERMVSLRKMTDGEALCINSL